MDKPSDCIRDLRADFVEAMSRAAFSVSIVATDGAAGRAGMTVSAMTSVSADPPTMLVCVHRASRFAAAVRDNGCFAISLLGQGQEPLADAFAGRGEGDDRFSQAPWQTLQTGSPLLPNAPVGFDCRLDGAELIGTHYVVIGTVVEIRTTSDLEAPLVHHRRRYARLALDSQD